MKCYKYLIDYDDYVITIDDYGGSSGDDVHSQNAYNSCLYIC